MNTPLSETEVTGRLEIIRRYNDYHTRGGQRHHCVTRGQLEQTLIGCGADPKRAKGIGIEVPPSAILANIQNSGMSAIALTPQREEAGI